MASSKKVAEFPDVEAKLQKPTKQSAFERQKAEAEAKRKREAAETAAVFEDFVKSFDHNDDDADVGGRDGRRPQGRFHDRPGGHGGQPPFGGGAASRRHFGMPASSSALKSGPGSLGPPPPSYGKRSYDGFQQGGGRRDRDEGRGLLGADNNGSGASAVSRAFDTSDDEEAVAAGRAEEKAVAKPTLRLSNLPPGMSPSAVKAMLPVNLMVENVRILPASAPVGNERRSLAAIVTLSKETPATDMDTAVTALQNRYLGYGFYLSLHRHLSSAAISSGLANIATSTSASHPFGAKPVAQTIGGQRQHSAGQGRGFAPPSSYGPPSNGPVNRNSLLHVPIKPPQDIKQLRMIHKVIESALEHGPEFEALLMSRPDVQKEEKWAWLWDARSEGGIWYRWRLWEIITGSQANTRRGKYVPLFEGSHAWKVPEQRLPFEYTTGVDGFVSESEYNSLDEDEFDDEPKPEVGVANDSEDMFLNPIEKAKLAHLLARMPTTLSKLRKGDIARVTTFAITHASRGSDEIVDMIVSNIDKPLAFSSANPNHKAGEPEKEQRNDGANGLTPEADDKQASDTTDTSSSSLLGLYLVSDILSSSSTSGVRHAWRYRQLFENALRRHKTFESLGLMAERLNWGRLRAEKWKRSVGLVLSLWEGWCVFPQASHEYFAHSFENPPSQKKEEKIEEDEPKRGGRWKTVEASAAPANGVDDGFRPIANVATDTATPGGEADIPVEPDDIDEDQVFVDEDEIDLEALESLDLDGEPIDDGAFDGKPLPNEGEMGDVGVPSSSGVGDKAAGGFQVSSAHGGPPRKRPRAVDMFADSDGEDST